MLSFLLRISIVAPAEFVAQVSRLAGSKWTEFKVAMMDFGLGIMMFSLLFLYFVIRRVIKLFGTTRHKVSGGSGISFGSIFAWGIHAMSFFLSNSKLGLNCLQCNNYPNNFPSMSMLS
ncbi:hypothetical protein MLD38_035910 [Melastoma candidum]|uniref:Uncharacterized protein n=1 Tax=Melastoma candidum TaxID=119954 RepID=A0ACB9LJV4_9MYRT|nr:hypothetical protein MLD38_035910 [Melastoma candidum]